jgi:DNA-directed RNA polymerase
MKKSLETLYSDSERPEAMDKVSDALDGVEPAELFSNTYDMAQQRALEEGAYTSALEVWKFELAESLKRGEVIPGRLGIRGLAWDWVQAMKPVLEQQIINVCPPDVNQYGQEMRISLDKDTESARLDKVWLSALPVETLCAITITEVIRHQVSEARSNGCKATTLIANVGRAVEKEMQAADLVRKENKGLHPKNINLRQLMTRKRTAERYAAKFHKEVVQGTLGGTSYWPYEWRADVRIRVHSFRDYSNSRALQFW